MATSAAAALTSQSSTLSTSTSTPPAPVPIPPALEQTLAQLGSHRAVLGYLLLSRTHPVSIIRHTGAVFDGERGKRYAGVVGKIVESVKDGLVEVNHASGDLPSAKDSDSEDDLRFLRIRTKKHEIMISPDDRYLLAVLYDPAT